MEDGKSMSSARSIVWSHRADLCLCNSELLKRLPSRKPSGWTCLGHTTHKSVQGIAQAIIQQDILRRVPSLRRMHTFDKPSALVAARDVSKGTCLAKATAALTDNLEALSRVVSLVQPPDSSEHRRCHPGQETSRHLATQMVR